MRDEFFMEKAIELSKATVAHGNEPFGAVLVKDDEIVITASLVCHAGEQIKNIRAHK